MTVDGIDDDRQLPRVRRVHERLELVVPAEALVNAEVADRKIAPVNLAGQVDDGHDAQAVDAEVGEVVESLYCAVEVDVELGQVDLVHRQVLQCRDLAGGIGRAPREGLAAQSHRRLLADSELASVGVDDPVDPRAVGIGHHQPVDIPAGRPPAAASSGSVDKDEAAARGHRRLSLHQGSSARLAAACLPSSRPNGFQATVSSSR